MDLFQVCCVVVLAIAYPLVLRAAPSRPRRLGEAALLVVASWAAEQSCISAYGFYRYAPGWWLPVGDVPLLVPLIWPMVILSARDVVKTLWPGRGAVAQAALIGAAVAVDASLMEVIATSAGLWRWSEPGYLGVPVIGIVGWGYFAAAATAWLALWERRSGPRWLLPLFAVAVTHLLLLASWWGAFRWGLRGALPPAWSLAVFGGLTGIGAVAVFRVRSARRLRWDTTGARLCAFAVFLALLVGATHRTDVAWLWLHTALLAMPYLLASPSPRRRPAATTRTPSQR